MPFLANVADSPHYRQARQLSAKQDKERARRDFWFKIKFSVCLLAAVGVGSFIFWSVVTL